MDGNGMSWQEAMVAAVAIAFLFGGIAVVLVAIMRVGQTKVASDASSQHEMMVRIALANMRDRLAKIKKL